MADKRDNFALARRWQRARQLFEETRIRRGTLGATVVLARLVLLKVPLLMRHLWAARRVRPIRAAIAETRAQGESLPYLAFAVTGGLGDMMVIARFTRDLAARAGGLRFDVYSPSPKQADWVFGALPEFGRAYHDIAFMHMVGDYDLALRANQTVVIYEEQASWRSLRGNRNLTQAIDAIARFRPKIDVFVDNHPWFDNFLGATAVFAGASRRDYLHHIAGLRYGGDRLDLPRDTQAASRFGLTAGRYVTVHNGFDPGFVISARRATKCYPHFGAVVARLKRALPHLTFVQVGVATSERIGECDLVLLNRTTLDEVAGLIGGAALHLDNEGGLVHLAACLGTSSAVLFGPTPADYFGYPGNINISPPVCGGCWYMTRTWMDACAKDYDVPRCLSEQDPVAVAERILVFLAGACTPPLAQCLNPTGDGAP